MTNSTTTQNADTTFSSVFQSEFIKQFYSHIAEISRDIVNGGPEHIEPLAIIDKMTNALRESGADKELISAVEALKSDTELVAAVATFQAALDGNADITSLPKSEPAGPIWDPGLNGSLLKGDREDLARFNDYILGSTSSFGSVISAWPPNFVDKAHKIEKFVRLKDVLRFEKIMEKDVTNLVKLNDQNRKLNFDVEGAYHRRLNYIVHTIDGNVIPVIRNQSPKDKLILKLDKTAVALNRAHTIAGVKAKSTATKTLTNVNNGLKGAAIGFGTSMGAVGIAANVQSLNDLEQQYKEGVITQEEYNYQALKMRLATANGSMMVAKGITDTSGLIAKKLTTSLATASKAARFIPVAGSLLSVGIGTMSLVKHAMAANESFSEGNHGRGGLQGLMTALDAVTITLDSVSLALDFIPGVGTVASFAIDLISTIISFLNDAVGLWADRMDTRTDEQKWQSYINSTDFMNYKNDLVKTFTSQGYDIMRIFIDEGFKADKPFEYEQPLSEKARKLLEEGRLKLNEVRQAIVDFSSQEKVTGGAGSDLIHVVSNHRKIIYGGEGDDVIFAGGIANTVYGGQGNDYLISNGGRELIFGGEGNDSIVFRPGVNSVISGNEGNDTAKVRDNVKSIYLDLGRQVSGNGMSDEFILDHNRLVSQLLDTSKLGLWGQYYANGAREKLFVDGFERILAHSARELTHAELLSEIGNDKTLWKLFVQKKQPESTTYFTDGSHLYVAKYIKGKSPTEGGFKYMMGTEDLFSVVQQGLREMSQNKGINYTVESLLNLLFFCTKIGHIENIDVDIDGPIQIFGDNQDNMILLGSKVSGDHSTVVSVKDGNNIIMVKSAPVTRGESLSNHRYPIKIIGGQGHDTLVLSSTAATKENMGIAYRLIRPETPINPNSHPGKHFRTLGIETVVLDDTAQTKPDNYTVDLDASDLTSDLNIIVRSKSQVNVTGTQKNNKLTVLDAGDGSIFVAPSGNGVLDLSSFEGKQRRIIVDLTHGFVADGDGWSPGISGFTQVIASRSINCSIYGDDNDNILIADGGSHTLRGRGGNNILVAKRGVHMLIGGKGHDTYIISGPLVNETVVIEVQRDKDKGLRASSQQGVWQNNKLTLDVLGADRSALTLDGVRFVDNQGKDVTSKGKLSIQDNKIIFELANENDFAELKNDEKQSLYVSYNSLNSRVTIDAQSTNNTLVVGHFTDAGEIRVEMTKLSHDLVFKDTHDNVVFIDKNWGDKLRSGMTNLLDLAVDFTRRFPRMVLSNSDAAKPVELGKVAIYNLITSQLSAKMQEANADWDQYLVTSMHDTIQLGSGNNTVIVDEYGYGSKGFDIRLGSGNNIVYATTGTEVGADNVTNIRLDSGNDVVIIGNSARMVNIYFAKNRGQGQKTLLIKKWSANTLEVSKGVVGNKDACHLSMNGVMVASMNREPDVLAFDDGTKTWLVSDVSAYMDARMNGKRYELTTFLGQDQQIGLYFSGVGSDKVLLDIDRVGKGVNLKLRSGSKVLYTFSLPELTNSTILRDELAYTLALLVPNGIGFDDKQMNSRGVSDWVKDILRDSKRYTIGKELSLDGGASEEDLKRDWKQLPLQNASFESNKLSTDFEFTPAHPQTPSLQISVTPLDIPGWSFTGFGSRCGGILSDVNGVWGPGGKSNNANRAYLPAHASMSQVVGYYSADMIYSLSLDYFAPKTGIEVRIWSGNVLVAHKVVTGAESATKFATNNQEKHWQTLTMRVLSAGGLADVANGGKLKLEIVNYADGNQPSTLYVNNIRMRETAKKNAGDGNERGWTEIPLENGSFQANKLEKDGTLYHQNGYTTDITSPVNASSWNFSGFGSRSHSINTGVLPPGAEMRQVVGNFEFGTNYLVEYDFFIPNMEAHEFIKMNAYLWAGDRKILNLEQNTVEAGKWYHRKLMVKGNTGYLLKEANGQPLQLQLKSTTYRTLPVKEASSSFDIYIDNIKLSQDKEDPASDIRVWKELPLKDRSFGNNVSLKDIQTPPADRFSNPPMANHQVDISGWDFPLNQDGRSGGVIRDENKKLINSGAVSGSNFAALPDNTTMNQVVGNIEANTAYLVKLYYFAPGAELSLRLWAGDILVGFRELTGGQDVRDWETADMIVSVPNSNTSGQPLKLEIANVSKTPAVARSHYVYVDNITLSKLTIGKQSEVQQSGGAEGSGLARLTGAMATFDSVIMADGSHPQESPYRQQPVPGLTVSRLS